MSSQTSVSMIDRGERVCHPKTGEHGKFCLLGSWPRTAEASLKKKKKKFTGADGMYSDVTMCQSIGDNFWTFRSMVREIWEEPITVVSLHTEPYDPVLKLYKNSLH